jgi:hypothetical protein
VQGLKSAKEVWDVLKTAHEGDELTKITKRETIEGELGRFRLRKGEEPQDMYNRLKTLVNQVRNLGSKKWDDHEMVKVILRSLIFLNPTQVQLIRGNPRYTLITPEEVIGNFVSFEYMIKGSKKINELDEPSTSEAQPVAFKAMEEKKEESTPSRTPIDASKLDNEEMALVIKSFRQILKQRRGKDYKPRSKKVCYKCGKPGHFIAKCPISSDSDRGDDKRGRRKEKKKYYKKKGGDAHVCREWDSDESSSDSSSDEDATNIAVTKGLLFPNVGHKCLMAKDGKKKKVKSKSSTRYESSSDEEDARDEEDNLHTIFANLSIQQKEKLNELVSVIHEKDDLLDSQEDFLIKENKKHVKVKNAYALEVEKCEKLSSELSSCHETIDNLRNENASLSAKVDSNVCDVSIPNLKNNNDDLLAKIDELNITLASLRNENEKLLAKAKELDVCNGTISDLRDKNDILRAKIIELNSCKPSTFTVEHTTISTRCRDVDVNAIHDHMALIKQQNDHIAKLDAKIAEHNLENEKFKFARSMLYSGRRPGIKDGIGFQKGTMSKLVPPKKLSNFVKGKAPMPQDNEGYILYPAGYPEDKIRRIRSRKSHSGPKHAFMYKGETSSSRQPTRAKLPKKITPSAPNDRNISFKTFDASYVLTNKSDKVVAKFVGGKHKGAKTYVWVPKVLVSNAKGPKTVWVPKTKN